jgi:hypothetical protein
VVLSSPSPDADQPRTLVAGSIIELMGFSRDSNYYKTTPCDATRSVAVPPRRARPSQPRVRLSHVYIFSFSKQQKNKCPVPAQPARPTRGCAASGPEPPTGLHAHAGQRFDRHSFLLRLLFQGEVDRFCSSAPRPFPRSGEKSNTTAHHLEPSPQSTSPQTTDHSPPPAYPVLRLPRESSPLLRPGAPWRHGTWDWERGFVQSSGEESLRRYCLIGGRAAVDKVRCVLGPELSICCAGLDLLRSLLRRRLFRRALVRFI